MTDVEERAKEYVRREYPRIRFGAMLEEEYATGAKENGVVWHDLRKDPEDLPTDPDREVVAYYNKDMYMTTATYRHEQWELCYGEMYIAPVAWCELPRCEFE